MKQRRERGLPHDTVVMSNWYLIWSLHWLGIVSDGSVCMSWWCSRRVEWCRMKSLDAKSSDLGCRVWRWCSNLWFLYHSSFCLLLVLLYKRLLLLHLPFLLPLFNYCSLHIQFTNDLTHDWKILHSQCDISQYSWRWQRWSGGAGQGGGWWWGGRVWFADRLQSQCQLWGNRCVTPTDGGRMWHRVCICNL